jgi:quinol monooxygenase YgiN
MSDTGSPYVRIAEIEIDPDRLDAYRMAVAEEIAASVRVEPGVLALYAVSDRDDPTHVTVFEIYSDIDAYRAHLETPHFLRYKTVTADMVKSLTLRETTPIMLTAKT